MAKPPITIEQVIAACEADDCRGFCIACGTEAYGVEPDARGYVCESCGAELVYEKACPCADGSPHSEICCGKQMKKKEKE